MAYRPTWQGHLRLSLVTCPVALYAATSEASEVHFHLINPETNNRIRMIATDPDAGPVERSELVKGFEIEKDEYVLLSPEDLEAVKLESTKVIDIERFVPAAEIDRLYWDTPYYLAPDGKLAQEAFGVIREALRKAEQIALGRVVISSRERLLALEPRDRGILAYTLRTAEEVRSSDTAFDGIANTKPDADMIAIAEKIIEQRAGPFDPSEFVDRYEEALKALIARKRKGQKPVASEAPKDTNVVDLMHALRASLDKSGAAKPSPKKRATARTKRRAAR
jgi:DNA end-binding protein Ku